MGCIVLQEAQGIYLSTNYYYYYYYYYCFLSFVNPCALALHALAFCKCQILTPARFMAEILTCAFFESKCRVRRKGLAVFLYRNDDAPQSFSVDPNCLSKG